MLSRTREKEILGGKKKPQLKPSGNSGPAARKKTGVGREGAHLNKGRKKAGGSAASLHKPIPARRNKRQKGGGEKDVVARSGAD